MASLLRTGGLKGGFEAECQVHNYPKLSCSFWAVPKEITAPDTRDCFRGVLPVCHACHALECSQLNLQGLKRNITSGWIGLRIHEGHSAVFNQMNPPIHFEFS